METAGPGAGFQDEGRGEDVARALDALYALHGKETFDEPDDLLGSLIATLLNQSTSGINASRAFGSLVDTFGGDWDRVRRAPVGEVAEAIVVGGLSNQKAPRIQKILAQVHEDRGEYSLEFLREWEPEAARGYLLGFKGVGPKTAAFTLAYAAQMPLFAMNTDVMRVSKRVGWVPGGVSDERAHELMQGWVPQGDYDAAHIALVTHGRRVCTSRKPRCAECPLRPDCDDYTNRTA
jgi:endonuclease-3